MNVNTITMMKKKVKNGTRSTNVCLIIATSRDIDLKILSHDIVLRSAKTSTIDMEHVL